MSEHCRQHNKKSKNKEEEESKQKEVEESLIQNEQTKQSFFYDCYCDRNCLGSYERVRGLSKN